MATAKERDRTASAKRYAQFCPVARALDVLGERWTLLVVRDLLMGPKRYTDLREGLPGIATDLLTARLRSLESAGFIERRRLPRPAPATVYELTDTGRQLAPAVLALGQVGLGLLGTPAAGEDVRADPLVLSLRLAFRPDAFDGVAARYQLVLDDEPYGVTVADGTVKLEPGTVADPDLTLSADATTFARLLTRERSASDAIANGDVEVEGDRAALDRFLDGFAYPEPAAASETTVSASASS